MRRPTTPKAKKRFGQNFLIDSYVIEQIIRLIKPKSGDHILEIGPGAGALTGDLVNTKASVAAIEVDKELAQSLARNFVDASNFTLHNNDVMKFDLSAISDQSSSWKVVGNLPYNIATPLIMKLVTIKHFWSEMTFMLQKEVALRLTARCGSHSYGRLSIMAQRQAQISYKLEVDATSFEPQPKVESAIVQIHPLIRNRNSRVDACLEKIVRLAFSTRRKTIANSLKSFVPVEVIKCANIDPKCRAETLAITDYERLTGKMLDASLDKNCL